jgi:hypothetical protein
MSCFLGPQISTKFARTFQCEDGSIRQPFHHWYCIYGHRFWSKTTEDAIPTLDLVLFSQQRPKYKLGALLQ